MVSGAAGSRRGDGADAWDVRNVPSKELSKKAFLCLFREAIGSYDGAR